ncbi:MAG: hypothetical protein M3O71_16495 [Bacteroidota bacterium]|nr:hypothetical protein [Bacteroidota bacterium]
MKKLKISMLALLFTVGIGGATVQKIHAAPKKFDDPTYKWSDNVTSDVADAEDRFGCSGAGATCSTGTLVSGQQGDPVTATIKHN